jgi:hypothetical protein
MGINELNPISGEKEGVLEYERIEEIGEEAGEGRKNDSGEFDESVYNDGVGELTNMSSMLQSKMAPWTF